MRSVALMRESPGPEAPSLLLHSAEDVGLRGYGVVPTCPAWRTGWLGARSGNGEACLVSFTMLKAIGLDGLRTLIEAHNSRGALCKTPA